MRFVRLVGQVVVAKGQQKLAGVFEHVFESGAPVATDTDEPAPNVAMPEIEDDDVEQPIVVRHLRSAYDLDEAALLAIPDYDSLRAACKWSRGSRASRPTSSKRCERTKPRTGRGARSSGRVAQLQQSA